MSGKLFSLFTSDHTHCYLQSTVVNVAEVVVEEVSPYKELFTTVALEQGLVAAATSLFSGYFVQLPILLWMNLITKVMNSIANRMNSMSKEIHFQKRQIKLPKIMTNSNAKTCN